MARRHVDLKAKKAAKQKKIAIGGGILFVALLAFSVPKTMKLMHPHHDVATTAHATTTQTASGTTTPPAATTSPVSTPAPVPVSNTSAAPVLTARLAPAARQGQLASLSASFRAKDPFKQLIDPNAPTATAAPQPAAAPTAKPATPNSPAAEPKVAPAAKPAPTPTATPAVPKPMAAPRVVLPLRSAVISVNGTKEGVNLKLDFPTDAPLFHLVSLTKKTAKVTVVGGSLVGAPTLILRRGKAVTLVNTADGTRYKLELVSTSTKALPTKKAPNTTSAAPTTQTSTTPGDSTTPTDTTTTTAADPVTVPPLGG